jgi:HEAT repeat protein
MMGFAEDLRHRAVTVADELEAERRIEAVARRADLFADRVVAALSDANVKEWAELLVTDAAGEMRLENAIPGLLEKLKGDDSELLWEVAADALVHIGSENVIRQIVEQFPGGSVGFRISAAGVLGRIKRPESQSAVLQLLDAAGDDQETATPLIGALVELLPDDEPTFSRLRTIARDGRYDRRDIHLDEDLLTLATMTGRDLPEAGEWRERIARSREEWARGMSNVDQLIQSPAAMGQSMLHVPPLAPRGGGTAVADAPPPRQRREPFKHRKPKVGRNDACPCGSGKKFKKCCGK